MHDKIINLNDNIFAQEVVEKDGLFLVDFWADWCTPCKMMTPIIEEVADACDGTITFFKLNVNENPMTAKKYNIRSIPTLLIFRDGEVVATSVGALSKIQLQEFIYNNSFIKQ